MGSRKSVRVQLHSEEQEHLTKAAYEFGCIYDGEGSLSLLLANIARGSLEIVRPNRKVTGQGHLRKEAFASDRLIGIEITVVSELNGVIAKIAEKIGESGGNIYDIKARDPDPTVRVNFCMNQEGSIKNLVEKLNQLKIQDIFDFNKKRNLEHLLNSLDSNNSRIYRALSDQHNTLSQESKCRLLNDFLDINKEKKLITRNFIIIGFRVETKNLPGNLAKLTTEIAKKCISILEIDQKFDPSKENNTTDLFLGFDPIDQEEMLLEIDNVKNFMKSLKRLDYIENIYQLSVSLG